MVNAFILWNGLCSCFDISAVRVQSKYKHRTLDLIVKSTKWVLIKLIIFYKMCEIFDLAYIQLLTRHNLDKCTEVHRVHARS